VFRPIGSLIALTMLSVFADAAFAKNSHRELLIEVEPGVQIHAIEAGSDRSKAALVLIPGWGLTASIWDDQIDVFAKERFVIAIDPRSQGQSTKTAEGDTPEQRARDLSGVLKHFALESIVLVGWSQGVQDVAAYVDQFGTRGIKGIVLVDAPVSAGAGDVVNHPQPASQELGLMAIYAASPKAYSQGMIHAIIQRQLSDDKFNRLVAGIMQTPTAIGVAMLVADRYGPDRTPYLAKFDRPTLVIAAADSDELDAQKAMVAKLPQGRLQMIQKAGHAVFLDQPEKFSAIVAQFIESL
jgi:non-heme chloroperoxidase